MTVSNTVSRNQYSASSGQTVFPYTFEVFASGDITVLQNDTTLAEGTNYSVSGVGSETGGNITLTVGATTGDIITVYRSMALDRTTDYQNSGDFLAQEVNDDFDRLWLAMQQGEETHVRAIVKPVTDAASISMELPEAATRVNTFLAFDATGAVTVVPAGDSTAPDAITRQQFTGDGSTTVFTLAFTPGVFNNSLQVYVDGVHQSVATYSTAGTTLTFSEAPPVDAGIEVVFIKLTDIGETDSSLVSYVPAGTGAVATTVQTKLRETVSSADFGTSASNTAAANTVALQAAIDANTDGGEIHVPKGHKFNFQSLTINVNEFNLVYWAEDEDDRVGGSVPGTNERIYFSNNWKQNGGGTVDVNEWRYEAAYHPGVVINAREDLPNSGSGTKQGLVSLVLQKNSYNQWQINGGKSVYDDNYFALGSWEVRLTFPIGSSSFSVSPTAGEQLVGDASGANGVILAVTASDMLVSWSAGTFVAGETVTAAGTKTSTISLPSAPTFVYNNKPWRIAANIRTGGQGANTPPDHLLDSWTVGGVLTIEDGQGGGFGTTTAKLNFTDDVTNPAVGFYIDKDPTSGLPRLSDHTFTPKGHLEDNTMTISVADAATGGSSVTPTQNCYYRRTMEGIVHFEIFLLNINTAGLTAGNPVYIRGLPVAAKNNGNARRICSVVPSNVTSTTGNIVAMTVGGQTYLELTNITTTGNSSLLVSAISSGSGDLYISGTYYHA